MSTLKHRDINTHLRPNHCFLFSVLGMSDTVEKAAVGLLGGGELDSVVLE